MKEQKNLSEEIEIVKEEPSGNYRIKKYNNRNFFKNYWILLNSRMDMTEDRISEIEERTI